MADSQDGTLPAEPERWLSELTVRLDEPGAVVVPYFAPKVATVQSGKMWIDGGSWMGYLFDLVDEDVTTMERWGGGLERVERAARVFEDRSQGEYEIECLGEPEGDFCARYSDPSRTRPPLAGDDYLFRNGAHLPAGYHYLVVHAEFETFFQVNFTLDEPIWIGEHIPAGSAVGFGPEHFRGEYLDMVHCGSIVWCGVMQEATMPVTGDGEFALVKLSGDQIGAAYAKACITDDRGEEMCDDDGVPTPVGGGLVYTARQVVRMDDNPVITATMAGGPPLKDWTFNGASGWWVGGNYVTFTTPDTHPGRGITI